MGLFDKFSKKKTDKDVADEVDEEVTETSEDETDEDNSEEIEEEVNETPAEEKTEDEKEETAEEEKEDSAEEKAEETEEKPADNVIRFPKQPAAPTDDNHPTTRFTLMVENVFTIDENESIACVGNLHGTINKGDKFYIVHPKFPAGIEAVADTLVVDKETPEYAYNCRLAIKITSVTKPGDIPKYSVISNIRPQTQFDPNVPIENPFLIGLSMEYNRLSGDNEYTYSFMVALLTSRLITPAVVNSTTIPADGDKPERTEHKVSFSLIKHPNDESLHVLPMFTDMSALSLWKNAPARVDNKQSLVPLVFERSAEVALNNGGMVINPFGPMAVFVSKTNIQNTLNLGRQAVERQKTLDALKNNKK